MSGGVGQGVSRQIAERGGAFLADDGLHVWVLAGGFPIGIAGDARRSVCGGKKQMLARYFPHFLFEGPWKTGPDGFGHFSECSGTAWILSVRMAARFVQVPRGSGAEQLTWMPLRCSVGSSADNQIHARGTLPQNGMTVKFLISAGPPGAATPGAPVAPTTRDSVR